MISAPSPRCANQLYQHWLGIPRLPHGQPQTLLLFHRTWTDSLSTVSIQMQATTRSNLLTTFKVMFRDHFISFPQTAWSQTAFNYQLSKCQSLPPSVHSLLISRLWWWNPTWKPWSASKKLKLIRSTPYLRKSTDQNLSILTLGSKTSRARTNCLSTHLRTTILLLMASTVSATASSSSITMTQEPMS